MKKIDEKIAIEINDFSFSYNGSDRLAIDSVTESFYAGSMNLLIGKSGSGKTTLLRCLKNVLMPVGKYNGSIKIYGLDSEEIDKRDATSLIGFVSQNPDNQIVTDTVWHELAFGLENLGVSNINIRSRVAEMSEYFGISDWYERGTDTLSGGQKQLLNLASVMVCRPSILLLDEPTAQLDPIATKKFLEQIISLNRDLGTTIVMIEHNLEYIYEKVDKVVALDGGKVIASGDKLEVLKALGSQESSLLKGMPKSALVYEMLSGKSDLVSMREVRMWVYNYYKSMSDTDRHNVEKYLKESDMRNEKDISSKKENMVTLKNVSFSYKDEKKEVLRDLNLNIKSNKITAIIGGNGAGKSTLLKLITGIEKPNHGKIKIKDRNKVLMLPQNPLTIFTQISVEEELGDVLLNVEGVANGLSLQKKRKLVYDTLKSYGLDWAGKMHPYDLSGGEAQKLAMAKILLMKPDILLLDEPTKGIDPFFRMEFGKRLQDLLKERDITIIVVTHDVEWVSMFADECALLFDKGIVSISKTREFFAGNMFFTTGVNRIMSDLFNDCITLEDVSRIKNLSEDW